MLNPERKYSLCITPEEYKPEGQPPGDSLTELADWFKTDKGTIKHNYTKVYEGMLSRYGRGSVLDILEIGVACGSSLKMWSAYFKNANVTGCDIREECAGLCADYPNIEVVIADANTYQPGKQFDVIIDDGSHISADIVQTWENLWANIKPGGMYFIEDLRCTHSPEYFTMHNWNRSKQDFNRKHVITWLDTLMRQTDVRNTDIDFILYSREMLALRKKA